ncbi:MAG: peptide ABC transporter substrate-binding protein [Treponema sp.]|nr:peptide ABC transporter substrate-binding protein [Spirochaetia bacterium]MDD7460098.1 peptide ABC transporter substrate-binding protein [Spirochaetales bacterium]MDY5811086.1 peptide ABC transporter substrate-binding protein [Treponema sp.]MEE1180937.1 peptide ABC transporter substrate-binding protein [Treponema sp.]
MKKKIFFIVALGLLNATIFFAQEPAEQRTINISVSNHVYNMNPFTASYTSEAQLFTGLYEGLFSYEPVTLAPLPALCKSYKISRDKKRWTLTLRNGAKFSNGKEIKAQDVRNSFIRLLGTKGAPFASLIDNISGAQEFRLGKGKAEDVRIDVRDDYTLVIRLKEPMSHLAKILCHHSFSIVPEEKNVYSGPFFLENQSPSEIELKKNTEYWDAQNVKIPGIKFLIGDDYQENSFKYNNGELDWICGNADFSKIINKANLQMNAEFGTVYMFFKMQNEVWKKSEFRNALLEAIPYDELRKKFSIQAETLVNPLPGYPKVTGLADWDNLDAVEMMKDARKKYGIKEDEKLKIVFAVISGDQYLKEWTDILSKAWEPLGVELTTESTTAELYNTSIPEWNADLFYYSWIGDFADPLAFLELFRGGSSLNNSLWKNEKYDQLLLDALRQDTIEEQYKLMAQAEQILLDDAMVIPVSHPVCAHIIDLSVIGGWKGNALDIHPLKYLYLQEAPVKRIPNLVKLN